MPTHVIALHVGPVAPLLHNGAHVASGIVKHAVDGPVHLGALGFAGDGQADLTVHGGVDKAVYLYGAADYAWWRAELDIDIPHGTFGENLTVEGLDDAGVSVGDVLAVGGATIQVTSPREPCFKLGARMGDPEFPVRFRAAGRMGFYGRVLEAGAVGPGDSITVVERAEESVTIAEFHRIYVEGRRDQAALRRLASAPAMAASWIEWCGRRLAALGDAGGPSA